MKTLDYLDAVKRHTGITSDYALAARLGITRSAISKLQLGKVIFSDDVALSIAQILDLNPLEVIAQANIERAKTPEQRARWSGVMEKISAPFKDLISALPRMLPSSACADM